MQCTKLKEILKLRDSLQEEKAAYITGVMNIFLICLCVLFCFWQDYTSGKALTSREETC